MLHLHTQSRVLGHQRLDQVQELPHELARRRVRDGLKVDVRELHMGVVYQTSAVPSPGSPGIMERIRLSYHEYTRFLVRLSGIGILGLRCRPTTRFSSAAGRIDGARRATAQATACTTTPRFAARASGVCCERGRAARLAAGRRAGAHRTWRAVRAATMAGCTRWPAACAATDGARPTQPSRNAPRSRSAIRPTLRRWRRSTRMPGSVRVRDRPTPASAAPLAASVDRGARRHAPQF